MTALVDGATLSAQPKRRGDRFHGPPAWHRKVAFPCRIKLPPPTAPPSPSQDNLAARVQVLEEGLARTINIIDDLVESQTASTKLYGALERLLVDVSKSEVDR